MKKFLLAVAAIVALMVVNVKAIELPEVTDHEKVTIYIFRGHGCSHCYDAIEYLYQNAEKYSDYIDVKLYEVWYNENNRELKTQVELKFNENDPERNPVPYIVIGDSYTVQGFGSKTGDEMITAALKEYQNKKYKDVVASILKKQKIDVTVETLAQAAEQEGVTANAKQTTESTKEGSKKDTIISIGIIIFLIGGTAALVLSTRKNA